MGIAVKALKRIWRIITFRKGIYADVGKGNKFCSGVFAHEMSTIGKYNYIGTGTLITNAEIGNYCSIASGVKIGGAEHSISYITTYNGISGKNTQYDMFTKKSVIGNDVWIGANAVILQGVTIGTGAVIGAGAIVNKDVPDYAIAVGVPARIIRYRFDENKIQALLKSRWWEKDIKAARVAVKELEGEIL